MWLLTHTLIIRVRKKAAAGTLVPRRNDSKIAVSFDTDLKQPKHYGSSGRIDLVGGIGYHLVKHSESGVPGATETRLDDLGLAEVVLSLVKLADAT